MADVLRSCDGGRPSSTFEDAALFLTRVLNMIESSGKVSPPTSR
eukprot:CAMPEP_0184384714 /NCGR_PEP_ID=MMETSP0007-20130409/8095_1 /TAXON_ID=97485 /ORGANISM="Prymnesium parvum, Strain Texoma1" /LENGTH=43 /DNA_ID= /DNA_START= /DNA_END= /DNA_ORIENTATION=